MSRDLLAVHAYLIQNHMVQKDEHTGSSVPHEGGFPMEEINGQTMLGFELERLSADFLHIPSKTEALLGDLDELPKTWVFEFGEFAPPMEVTLFKAAQENGKAVMAGEVRWCGQDAVACTGQRVDATDLLGAGLFDAAVNFPEMALQDLMAMTAAHDNPHIKARLSPTGVEVLGSAVAFFAGAWFANFDPDPAYPYQWAVHSVLSVVAGLVVYRLDRKNGARSFMVGMAGASLVAGVEMYFEPLELVQDALFPPDADLDLTPSRAGLTFAFTIPESSELLKRAMASLASAAGAPSLPTGDNDEVSTFGTGPKDGMFSWTEAEAGSPGFLALMNRVTASVDKEGLTVVPKTGLSEASVQVLRGAVRSPGRMLLGAFRELVKADPLVASVAVPVVLPLASTAELDAGLTTMVAFREAPSQAWTEVGSIAADEVLKEVGFGDHQSGVALFYQDEDDIRAHRTYQTPSGASRIFGVDKIYGFDTHHLQDLIPVVNEIPKEHFLGVVVPDSPEIIGDAGRVKVFVLDTEKSREEVIETFLRHHVWWQGFLDLAEHIPDENLREGVLRTLRGLLLGGFFDASAAERSSGKELFSRWDQGRPDWWRDAAGYASLSEKRGAVGARAGATQGQGGGAGDTKKETDTVTPRPSEAPTIAGTLRPKISFTAKHVELNPDPNLVELGDRLIVTRRKKNPSERSEEGPLPPMILEGFQEEEGRLITIVSVENGSSSVYDRLKDAYFRTLGADEELVVSLQKANGITEPEVIEGLDGLEADRLGVEWAGVLRTLGYRSDGLMGIGKTWLSDTQLRRVRASIQNNVVLLYHEKYGYAVMPVYYNKRQNSDWDRVKDWGASGTVALTLLGKHPTYDPGAESARVFPFVNNTYLRFIYIKDPNTYYDRSGVGTTPQHPLQHEDPWVLYREMNRFMEEVKNAPNIPDTASLADRFSRTGVYRSTKPLTDGEQLLASMEVLRTRSVLQFRGAHGATGGAHLFLAFTTEKKSIGFPKRVAREDIVLTGVASAAEPAGVAKKAFEAVARHGSTKQQTVVRVIMPENRVAIYILDAGTVRKVGETEHSDDSYQAYLEAEKRYGLGSSE